jgi:uncharacterized protein DUF3291
MSRHHHLAQVNIGRIRGPIDSDIMSGFVSQLPSLNALADASPGFVWRLQSEQGNATSYQPYADPMVLLNLSVWESVEALTQYTYHSDHVAVFRNRAQWFERPTEAYLAMWWIPAGHIPTIEEAVDRLDYRRSHGETPAAFSFTRAFPAPAEPEADPVLPAVDLDGRCFITGSNSSNGDADARTRFHYRQNGGRVWAIYRGGRVRFGSLVAAGAPGGALDVRYHHVDVEGALRTGTCISTPELLPDGRVRLVEEWQWTNGDGSRGSSVLEEARP